MWKRSYNDHQANLTKDIFSANNVGLYCFPSPRFTLILIEINLRFKHDM